MNTFFWWYRYHFWQWLQAGRSRPLKRAAALLAWWLPCFFAPLFLLFAHRSFVSPALDHLLSLDVPLTLALTGATALDAMGVNSRNDAESWLWPRAFRPVSLRWMAHQRGIRILRWPAGFAMFVTLLASGYSYPPALVAELLLMAVIGLIAGSSIAWTLHGQASQKPRPVETHQLQGVTALSRVSLREAGERFNLRRAMILAIPALLAAPLGAPAVQVAGMVAIWLPLLFAVIVCRETAQVHRMIFLWLRGTIQSRLRLTYWIWRNLAWGIAALAVLGVLFATSDFRVSARRP